jgi:hypothetical protein
VLWVFILILLIFPFVYGELEVIWNSTITGSESESPLSIEKGSDNYLVIGTAWSSTTLTDRFFAVAIDRYGRLVTEDVSLNHSYGSCIAETREGFIIVGSTMVGEDFDIFFLGLDSFGYKRWMRTYSYPYSQGASCITPTFDDCFIVGAYNYSMEGEFGDIWLLKTDIDGSITWQKTITHPYPVGLKDVVTCSDGGYLFVGSSSEDGQNNVYLLRISEEGDPLWEKTVKDPRSCWATSIIPDLDDGFIVVGEIERRNSWYPDTLVFKINGAGETVWEYTLSGFGSAQDMIPLREGFVVSGTSSISGRYQSFLIKIDYDGNQLWNMTYEGNIGLITESFEEGFIVTGRVFTEEPKPFGDSDIFLASFAETQKPINENLIHLIIITGIITWYSVRINGVNDPAYKLS